MTVHEQHIHRLELRDEAVPLEFLPNLGANGRHGHVEGVHGLDFGGLWTIICRSALIVS